MASDEAITKKKGCQFFMKNRHHHQLPPLDDTNLSDATGPRQFQWKHSNQINTFVLINLWVMGQLEHV